MIGMNLRMMFNTFRTHEFETRTLGAKISDRFMFMFVAGNVVFEVGFHVLKSECFVHGSYDIIFLISSSSSKIS